MKDRGYDVSVGDMLQVIREMHCGLISLVKDVNVQKAEVQLIFEVNTRAVVILIPLCGLLLNGAHLQGPLLEEFQRVVARSYRCEDLVPCAITLPPTPNPDEDFAQDSAWSITAQDHSAPIETLINKGCIGWLFDNSFCDFSQFVLCFNISAVYYGGNYSKRIMQTASNHFANKDGPAPLSSVCLSISSNHAGAKLEDHHVPVYLLDPASSTSKDQYVLVLQGDLKGTFCKVLRWIRKEKKVEVTAIAAMQRSKVVLGAVDICLAIPFSS
ncbi:hypothetical protein J3R82DRAFT_11183 [Butyriboletus roseoflavus]|nr:hypothetical protein J3R82DRAFT_11183 [Butyriboletus roseoflavus]